MEIQWLKDAEGRDEDGDGDEWTNEWLLWRFEGVVWANEGMNESMDGWMDEEKRGNEMGNGTIIGVVLHAP